MLDDVSVYLHDDKCDDDYDDYEGDDDDDDVVSSSWHPDAFEKSGDSNFSHHHHLQRV